MDPVEDPAAPAPDPEAGSRDVVDHAAAISPRRRRQLLLTFALITLVVLAADQLSKAWALSALEPGTRTPLLGDLFGLQLIRNSGAALSLANGMTWVLTVVACVVVVVVIRASRRLGSLGWALAFGLLLGGALGNLVDRFWREPGFARGHVVDFLAYGNWFIGNVADIAIVAAAGLVMILALRGVGLDGARESDGHDVPSVAPSTSDEEAPGRTEAVQDDPVQDDRATPGAEETRA
ncbi:signal peptidase II [Cellulomonas soli]|uniref:signal peptidase II n=1 Tax=Cellulomonas soli TaxID=931535 RepID=UPI003F83D4AE